MFVRAPILRPQRNLPTSAWSRRHVCLRERFLIRTSLIATLLFMRESRRIKEDGGCSEVYAVDDTGERVEAYFHPLTLESVPTKKR